VVASWLQANHVLLQRKGLVRIVHDPQCGMSGNGGKSK
jgi:hypothetical protein